MFCRNCGNQGADQALICLACGVPPRYHVDCCGGLGPERRGRRSSTALVWLARTRLRRLLSVPANVVCKC